MKRSVRVLALLMALIILFASPLRVAATGLEGAILGGTTGIALSEPHIAMLILAAFGIAYGWEHREEIGRSYHEGLDRAHQMQLDQLQDDLARREQINAELEAWKESAGLGAIDIATAPAWISDWVKSWVNGFIEGNSSIKSPIVNEYGETAIGFGGTIPANVGYRFRPDDPTMFFYCGTDVQLYKCIYTYYGSLSLFYLFVSDKPFKYNYTHSPLNSYDASAIWVGDVKYYRASMSIPMSLVNGSSDSAYFLSGAVNIDGKNMSSDDYLKKCLTGSIADPENDSIDKFPDVLTGGIVNQVSTGTAIDDISVPDIVVPGPDVFPVSPDEGQTTEDTIVKYLTDGLISGQITWDMYWKLLGVLDPTTGTAAPSITVPGTEAGAPSERFELTDNGVASAPVSGMPIGNFMIDLTQFFPFCLPFDVVEFFTILCAEPEAPVFHWEIPVPQLNQTFEIDVDLSAWDDVAYLFRKMELLAFIVGLAIVTREKYIRS